MQSSQEAGKRVWYSLLFKDFPQFVVFYTGQCLSLVSEADASLELSWFFYDPMDAVHLISCSSAFSQSSLNIWKFLVHVWLEPSLENSQHF